MNAIPARVAGVARIAMCVPTPDGVLNPLVLAAARRAGVAEIYRIGGAQAIAALAYGTASIAPVDRIVGPGNAYVAEAKRQVFGRVGIDAIAGPSEVVVLADAANDPRRVAVDLLAQAEHDEAAQAILITDDAAFADRVAAAVDAGTGDAAARRDRRGELAGARRDHRGARLGRGGRSGQPPGARASATDAARSGAGVRPHPPCRRGVSRRLLPRGGRRLRCRPEPCAADRPHRAVRLGIVGVRLSQAHHLGRGRCRRRWRASGRRRSRWRRRRGSRRTPAASRCGIRA